MVMSCGDKVLPRHEVAGAWTGSPHCSGLAVVWLVHDHFISPSLASLPLVDVGAAVCVKDY